MMQSINHNKHTMIEYPFIVSIIFNKSIATRFGCRIATKIAIWTILVSIKRTDSVLSNDGINIEFNGIGAKLYWI